MALYENKLWPSQTPRSIPSCPGASCSCGWHGALPNEIGKCFGIKPVAICIERRVFHISDLNKKNISPDDPRETTKVYIQLFLQRFKFKAINVVSNSCSISAREGEVVAGRGSSSISITMALSYMVSMQIYAIDIPFFES